MTAFLIGTVRISKPEQFAEYGAAIRGLSGEYGGESVVAGAVSEVLEGASPIGERVVVTRFPNAEQIRLYLSSPRYVAAQALRAGAAEVELRLIEV
jgi:uncharacterized protein (DUF1330 family)